jgi:hypothetical protein
MMATTFDPSKQDYSFSGDLSKINPAEIEPKDIETYKNALNDQISALEQRYEKPNWFKVAAGFAKPQLGGFFASLGSAAEALGENVEQRRAQQLPISQMKVQIQQANMLLGQKQKQNQIYQDWLAKNKKPDGTVQPMDATTYSRIMSLGDNTAVAQAATKYYEGAKAGLELTTAATTAGGKDPLLQSLLENFTKFQLRPDADEAELKRAQNQYMTALNAAKPPQMEQSQWDAMSRYEKMEASAAYGKAQREAGMGAEATMQQQASQAPTRLSLLSSIRDLAMGVGLKDTTKMVDGKETTVTGQQQMAALLNYFGGNNPFEVLARAAADGKLGDKLADIDKYARQNAMSPEARDHFQKLAKLLAENQVSLRNSSLNPTDASSMLQQAGSPNIGNSQTALISLVDLMGHSEQNALDRYRYVLDNRVPFRQLSVDPGYLQKQAEYATEHRKIATSNPLVNMPSWYNPAKGVKTETPAAIPTQGAPVAPTAQQPSSKPTYTPPKGWKKNSDGTFTKD